MQQQQQIFQNNLFSNIPETVPRQNLFPGNTFQQPTVIPEAVSPAACLPASLQQQASANPFLQYQSNTQQQQQQQQQQWNIQSMRPLNDLSSSTQTTTALTMNPFQQPPQQSMMGVGEQPVQMQESASSVPMNILPEGLLDSNDFSQLLLPNSTVPSFSQLDQAQENMTDSLTKMILKDLDGAQ